MEMRLLGKTGHAVSALGYGASPLGGVFGETSLDESREAVHCAVDLGINLFDVAPYYGLTRAETALGSALQGIARGRYLLATKVGRYGAAEFDFSAKRILSSIDESLSRLQTDYIDIITCHDIEFVEISQVIGETIPALQRAREAGKIRFIGVSGLPLKIYHTVLDSVPLDTVLSYCHYTLNDTSLEEHLEYFKAKEVGVINASPFAMGLLSGGPVPDWHPAPAALRNACEQVVALCRAHGASPAALALAFAAHDRRIASTLTGMRTRGEVEQNVRWVGSPPDEPLLAEVLALLAPVHNLTWPSGRPENA